MDGIKWNDNDWKYNNNINTIINIKYFIGRIIYNLLLSIIIFFNKINILVR